MHLLLVEPFVMFLSLVQCRSVTSHVLKYTRVSSSNDIDRQWNDYRQLHMEETTDNNHKPEIKRITLPSGGISDAFDIVHIMFGMLPHVTGSCGITTADDKASKWPPKRFMDKIELMLQRCVVKCNDVDTDKCVKEITSLIREVIKTRCEYGKIRTPVTTPSWCDYTIMTTCTARPQTRTQCTRIPLTTSTRRDITKRDPSPKTECNQSWLSVTTSSWSNTSTCTTYPKTRGHQSRYPYTNSICHDTSTTSTHAVPSMTCSHLSHLPFTTSTCRETFMISTCAISSKTYSHRSPLP